MRRRRLLLLLAGAWLLLLAPVLPAAAQQPGEAASVGGGGGGPVESAAPAAAQHVRHRGASPDEHSGQSFWRSDIVVVVTWHNHSIDWLQLLPQHSVRARAWPALEAPAPLPPAHAPATPCTTAAQLTLRGATPEATYPPPGVRARARWCCTSRAT